MLMTQTCSVLLIGRVARESYFDQSGPLPDLGSERHQYEISAVFAQTSFREKTGGVVVKCGLFSQAINKTRE